MREAVMRDLARRAATDPLFLREMRDDPEGALARHGFGLAGDELRLILNLRRQTAAMNDAQLARLLARGLEGRDAVPPARPASPARTAGTGPARPGRPGGPRRESR